MMASPRAASSSTTRGDGELTAETLRAGDGRTRAGKAPIRCRRFRRQGVRVAETKEMRRSSRDPAELQAGLERWLTGRLDAAAEPSVVAVQATATNGLSSDTVLFSAEWTDADVRRREELV